MSGWLRLVLFFFNDTATTEIYTLSLHDALPICIPALTAQQLAEFYRPKKVAVTVRLDADLVAWMKAGGPRSEEHTSELQSHLNLVCRLLLEKKKTDRLHRRHHPHHHLP